MPRPKQRRRTRKYRRKYAKKSKIYTPNQVHRFTRSKGETLTIYPAAGNPYAGYAFSFKASDVRSWSDFENLYDQFKVTHVQVLLTLRQNPDTMNLVATSLANLQQPRLFYVIDDTDSTAVFAPSEIKEYGRHKTVMMSQNRAVKINVKPKVQQPMYKSALANAYAPKRPPWMRIEDGNAPLYGLKIAFENIGDSTVVDVEIKYWFRCKQSK